MEDPIMRWMIWGNPHCRKPPYVADVDYCRIEPLLNNPYTSVDGLDRCLGIAMG
jgi:hypothetical protein